MLGKDVLDASDNIFSLTLGEFNRLDATLEYRPVRGKFGYFRELSCVRRLTLGSGRSGLGARGSVSCRRR